ncbi:aminotransferase class IV [Sansalvadorimonas sp. 2012CJ34-2]|uniref:Aminotransferase class IV n=1 Tax=Parendozoicomonas callyspongiae TaxID=2942213 RepID=A0ABT0PCQ5_9GAMM|nr:aminotransferase class IV [Sansalvadorimonas sp. 2012CJ34-2]MCL6269129.1 aminotransferase class IV [Sansalvadorimonas sp. 2012CJ34-2]
MAQVYLNGEFVPVEEAKVSVLDRGFLFGDGVYEVIPVFAGKPLQEDAHMERLYRSLDAIELELSQTPEDFHGMFTRLLELNKESAKHLTIYLQITRGVVEKRAHGFPEKPTPTVFAMTIPLEPNIRTSLDEAPTGRAITQKDRRWQRCDIKSTSLLGNLISFQKAYREGMAESILIDCKGRVTEGASSNVFAIIGDRIITPPLSKRILGGITRALVLEIATRDGCYLCEERQLKVEELREASEIWITSSNREILPIVELDGAAVGAGNPGEVWRHIAGLYRIYRDQVPEINDDRRTESSQD